MKAPSLAARQGKRPKVLDWSWEPHPSNLDIRHGWGSDKAKLALAAGAREYGEQVALPRRRGCKDSIDVHRGS